MGTPYAGNAANVTAPLASTIVGATNATPIVITTSANHLYATGDSVAITGVGGNTAANGYWKITVLSATTYSLDGSVGSGAYTSGGTAVNQCLTPQFTLPSNGDAFVADAWNVPIQAIADRTQYLSLQTSSIPDLTTLKAINTTGMTNNTVRHVKAHGFYTYDSASAATENLPWVVAPTTGSGRWISDTAHQTTLTRVVPCAAALRGMPTAANAPSLTSSWRPLPQASSVVIAYAGSLVMQVSSTHATNAWGLFFQMDEYMIDGAVLSSVTLRYEPGNVGADPAVFPQMAVGRDSRGGSTGSIDQMHSGGFQIDSGGTYEFGTVRNFVYTPNQANTIQLSTYSYFIVVYDEHGANASTGNNFIQFSLAFTSIPDARR